MIKNLYFQWITHRWRYQLGILIVTWFSSKWIVVINWQLTFPSAKMMVFCTKHCSTQRYVSLFIKDSIVISVFRFITPAVFPPARIIYPSVFHNNVPLIPTLPQLVCSFSIDFQSKEAHVLYGIPKKVRPILQVIFSSINTWFRSIHQCPLNTQEESIYYVLNCISFFIFKKSYMQFLQEKPFK